MVFLGEGKPGDVVVGTVRLVNEGRAPLRVEEVKGFCACAKLEPRGPFTVAPGGEQLVSVGIRLTAEGEERAVTISVKTNDPDHRVQRIVAVAKAPAFLLCSPASIQFGDVRQHALARRRFTLLTPEGDAWADPLAVRIVSTDPCVEVNRVGGGDTGAYEAMLTRRAPLGTLSATLRIRLAGEDRQISVPLLAHVEPLIFATPSILLYPGPDRIGAHRIMVVVKRTDGQALGRLSRIAAPDFLAVRPTESKGPQSPTYALLNLEFGDASIPSGSTSPVTLELWFEHCPEPARATVHLAASLPAQAGPER